MAVWNQNSISIFLLVESSLGTRLWFVTYHQEKTVLQDSQILCEILFSMTLLVVGSTDNRTAIALEATPLHKNRRGLRADKKFFSDCYSSAIYHFDAVTFPEAV